jgi:hypothetical protein
MGKFYRVGVGSSQHLGVKVPFHVGCQLISILLLLEHLAYLFNCLTEYQGHHAWLHSLLNVHVKS